MEKLQLNGDVRDIKTTTPNKLRKIGKMPAVLYGHNLKNLNLSVALSDFEKVLRKAGESTIVELKTDDGKVHPVLIHDVQLHYLTSVPIHADFYEVSMTEKLKAEVVLEFTGESKAVKELGGVFVRILNAVTVECLPADLPHNIPVDISALQSFQDSIHVKDIKAPNKVVILTPAEEIVAKVQPPREVEKELAEEKPVEDISKVEGAAEAAPAAAEGEAKESKKE